MPSDPCSKAAARRIATLLANKGLTLAVAESCTGGMIGAAVTEIPGASDFFCGGIIAYSNDVKRTVLGVPPSLLSKEGAVSAACVEVMAAGVARTLHADCAIAVSGVAGPGGGSEEKPVGTVYIGIVTPGTAWSGSSFFKGGRQAIREQTVRAALEKLVEML